MKFSVTKPDTVISWVTLQGFSWMRLKKSRCASIWYSLVTGNPADFTEISYLFTCQIYQLVLVQTGILQFCLDEWLAFKTHSRQGPWQTICKDVCFDFSHISNCISSPLFFYCSFHWRLVHWSFILISSLLSLTSLAFCVQSKSSTT